MSCYVSLVSQSACLPVTDSDAALPHPHNHHSLPPSPFSSLQRNALHVIETFTPPLLFVSITAVLFSPLLLVPVDFLKGSFVGSDISVKDVQAFIYHPNLLCDLLQ